MNILKSNMLWILLLAFGGALYAEPSPAKASRLIDMLVESDLDRKKLKPNPLVDDLTHLRRATLAIAGRIPSYDEIKAYESDSRDNKRAAAVDRLIDSSGYSRHMFTMFADFLRLRTHVNGNYNLHPYRQWLQESLDKNVAYDKMVKAMLTAEGNQYENPAAGYYLRDSGMPLDNLAMTTQVFLGTRMQCAQCHNHPSEKWTQVDFFKLASLLNSSTYANHRDEPLLAAYHKARREEGLQVSQSLNNIFRTQVTDPLSRRVNFRDMDARLPHDYAYDDFKPKSAVPADVPMGPKVTVSIDKKRIETFAEWLTSDKNEHFSMVIVNRLWKQVMGRGLFEPMDNITSETVITNKPLLTYLNQLFRDLDYDIKAFVAILCKTKTFQRGTVDVDPGVAAEFPFQGPMLRRMSAEQIWDNFVFLLRGKPGLEHPYLQTLDANHGAAKSQFYALKKMGPEQFITRLKSLQKKTAHIDPKINDLRQKIPDAEPAKKREMYQEIRKLQQEAATAFQVTFGDAVAGGSMGGMQSMTMMGGGGQMAAKPKGPPRSKLDQKWDKYLMASSNMVSPVSPGHELLVFGASERELADAASTQASVPQALIMLNGDNGPSLFWEATVLKENLAKQKTVDEAIDCLFLSLLGRYPDEKDRALSRDMIKRSGRFDGLKIVALAITQTNRFIFVD